MRCDDTFSGCIHPVAVLISGKVSAYGAPRCFLHRDALDFSALLKGELLFIR